MSLAAIVGGTASKLGGGKFANGAVSGAFVHMYNYTAHASEWLPKEGNRVERDYPILGKINNVSRGISKFLNTIGDAFSGGYNGARDAIQNAHPAARTSLNVAATIVVTPFLFIAGEYVITNPVQAYQFAEAGLNPAVTVAGTSSTAARTGQAVGWAVRQGF